MTAEPRIVAPSEVAPETWWMLESGPGPAAWNMAMDEALLNLVAGFDRVILRGYGWTEPAATFGYSQRFAEVTSWTTLRPLVRRPTGGGLVAHDGDWTYSLIVPPGSAWYELKASASYRHFHEWIRDGLAVIGWNVDLAGGADDAPGGRCFLRAETADLVWGGRKVAGAAQRRNRLGLLIQGSIQTPLRPVLDRAAFPAALMAQATRRWGVRWQTMTPTAELAQRASQLVAERYGLEKHNRRR